MRFRRSLAFLVLCALPACGKPDPADTDSATTDSTTDADSSGTDAATSPDDDTVTAGTGEPPGTSTAGSTGALDEDCAYLLTVMTFTSDEAEPCEMSGEETTYCWYTLTFEAEGTYVQTTSNAEFGGGDGDYTCELGQLFTQGLDAGTVDAKRCKVELFGIPFSPAP